MSPYDDFHDHMTTMFLRMRNLRSLWRQAGSRGQISHLPPYRPTAHSFISVSSKVLHEWDFCIRLIERYPKVGSDSDLSKCSREDLLHHITTFSGRRDWGVEAHCCDYSNQDRLWWYQASDHWNESGPEIRVKVLVEEEGRSKVDYPARDSHAPALEPAHASDKHKHTDRHTHRHKSKQIQTLKHRFPRTCTRTCTRLRQRQTHTHRHRHTQTGTQTHRPKQVQTQKHRFQHTCTRTCKLSENKPLTTMHNCAQLWWATWGTRNTTVKTRIYKQGDDQWPVKES